MEPAVSTSQMYSTEVTIPLWLPLIRSTLLFTTEIHPNSTVGGVLANLWMTGFNEHYGDTFELFTEQEILENAGPNLGAMYTMDTLTDSLGGKGYADYVFSPVPEPSSALMLIGLAAGLAVPRRRAA